MTNFRHLHLKEVYRSGQDDILQDFYIPALSLSESYDRAVGYFSAAMLTYAAQGLSTFIKSRGSIRLIFGGDISLEDFEAIKAGYDRREIAEAQAIGQINSVVNDVNDIADELFTRRLELLSFLIERGQLEVKIAQRPHGMYHEKIGIFTDQLSNKIIFQGSANETKAALLPDYNFESINVFPSWRPELRGHFQPYVDGFENLWNDTEHGVNVIAFPEAARRRLIEIRRPGSVPLEPEEEVELIRESQRKRKRVSAQMSGPAVPIRFGGQEFKMRPHQLEALESWRANGFRGVMALATGAGKTITAIYGATKMFSGAGRLFVVIAVPYQALADQWIDELEKFNIYPVACYENTVSWEQELSRKISLFSTGGLEFVCAVVVNRSMQMERFQHMISHVPADQMLFIGDECHHHGAEYLSKALPNNAKFRLGLSATPDDPFKAEKTQRIRDYYGDIVHKYELKDALRDGVLTPYTYKPIVVDLTEAEALEYSELSAKIAAAFARNDSAGEEVLGALLSQRSRLLGRAENKLVALKELLRGKNPEKLTLFYCGDAKYEDGEGERHRQVAIVTKTLSDLGWRCSHFTSYENRNIRQSALDNFKTGMIDALVAIRCLDEGIDVPACRTAYILASTRHPKQFIQRRGRILRKSPGKESAHIVDFIVRLPKVYGEASASERSLIRAEMERVVEFAHLSSNVLETVEVLRPLLREYDLEHLIVHMLSTGG